MRARSIQDGKRDGGRDRAFEKLMGYTVNVHEQWGGLARHDRHR
jgi:hypothetical protein